MGGSKNKWSSQVISVQKDKALGKKYTKDRFQNVMRFIRKYE